MWHTPSGIEETIAANINGDSDTRIFDIVMSRRQDVLWQLGLGREHWPLPNASLVIYKVYNGKSEILQEANESIVDDVTNLVIDIRTPEYADVIDARFLLCSSKRSGSGQYFWPIRRDGNNEQRGRGNGWLIESMAKMQRYDLSSTKLEDAPNYKYLIPGDLETPAYSRMNPRRDYTNQNKEYLISVIPGWSAGKEIPGLYYVITFWYSIDL